jgi:transketolase
MKKFEVRQHKDTRSGFGDALLELGKNNPKVVALCADLTGSLKMDAFKKAFPERFFQVGIAEANMMGIAAGLATTGFIPFAGTFAVFATGRVYDQIRQSIAYSNKNVKICASHAGLTVGEDGATHQMMEDLALMRALPNMTVINPCDYSQTYKATLAIAAWEWPVYLRFGRPAVPDFTYDLPFEIGKALLLQEGSDVSIFATGHMVWEAILAAQILEEQHSVHVEVINIHTLKPLDESAILASIKKTGCAVTAEEHVRAGGLGEAIAGICSSQYPIPIEMVTMPDHFGESGTPRELLDKYHLNAQEIVTKALTVLKRK